MRHRKPAYRLRRITRQAAGSARRAAKKVHTAFEGIDLTDARVQQALGVATGVDDQPS